MPKKWVFTGRNPVTGRKYYSLKKVVPPELTEPPSIDELPPLDPTGEQSVQLSKTPPSTLGGVTSHQLKTSRNTGGISGIEESQPRGDRD